MELYNLKEDDQDSFSLTITTIEALTLFQPTVRGKYQQSDFTFSNIGYLKMGEV